MKKSIFVLSFLLSASIAIADVRLPAIIGSHMVLQQKSTVKLWGWSGPAENITIKVGWDTTTYKVTASRGARWVTEIKTQAAGGPYSISIKGRNAIMLEEQTLEIHGLDDMLPHRSYVWIPSIQTIAGGVNVFGGLHAWTADTQTAKNCTVC